MTTAIPKSRALFERQELNYRTHYAELKQRTKAEGELLPGSPGSMGKKDGSGNAYWYRTYYSVPGKKVEDFVAKPDEVQKLAAMAQRMEFAEWMKRQVSTLRSVGFQVADKQTARVLIELHNRRLFEAGMVLVGTLAFTAHLNEWGAVAVAAQTQDIDLARRAPLELGMPLSFIQTMSATGLPFVEVPGMPNGTPETSVKLPGVQGLTVDLLAPGEHIGRPIKVPELEFAAQQVPYFGFLLDQAVPAASLAGWQCIPVRVPQVGRFVLHKLYSSLHRAGFPEKAEKDRMQAMTLTAVVETEEPGLLQEAFDAAPAGLRKELRRARALLLGRAGRYPEVAQAWKQIL